MVREKRLFSDLLFFIRILCLKKRQHRCLVNGYYFGLVMKKFTGILAIVILLVLSYDGKSPFFPMDSYAGEFHTKSPLKNEIYEKDIIIYDDTLVFIVP